jgi:hypothetical protein
VGAAVCGLAHPDTCIARDAGCEHTSLRRSASAGARAPMGAPAALAALAALAATARP